MKRQLLAGALSVMMTASMMVPVFAEENELINEPVIEQVNAEEEIQVIYLEEEPEREPRKFRIQIIGPYDVVETTTMDGCILCSGTRNVEGFLKSYYPVEGEQLRFTCKDGKKYTGYLKFKYIDDREICFYVNHLVEEVDIMTVDEPIHAGEYAASDVNTDPNKDPQRNAEDKGTIQNENKQSVETTATQVVTTIQAATAPVVTTSTIAPVQTGAKNDAGLWMGTMSASLAGAAIISVLNKKRKQ